MEHWSKEMLQSSEVKLLQGKHSGLVGLDEMWSLFCRVGVRRFQDNWIHLIKSLREVGISTRDVWLNIFKELPKRNVRSRTVVLYLRLEKSTLLFTHVLSFNEQNWLTTLACRSGFVLQLSSCLLDLVISLPLKFPEEKWEEFWANKTWPGKGVLVWTDGWHRNACTAGQMTQNIVAQCYFHDQTMEKLAQTSATVRLCLPPSSPHSFVYKWSFVG